MKRPSDPYRPHTYPVKKSKILIDGLPDAVTVYWQKGQGMSYRCHYRNRLVVAIPHFGMFAQCGLPSSDVKLGDALEVLELCKKIVKARIEVL